MTNDLWRLSLAQAARMMRERRISCVDYTRSCLERIEALEPQVQAWAWLDSEYALERAQNVDRAADSPSPPSGGEERADKPLLGIPLGIKDIFDTRGIPTEMGSSIFKGNRPSRSAEAVRRLEEAGAFVLGKTVTAEMAYFAPGKTRNPWSYSHTPGGSSSGSAAAVAAGFVPGALGNQTNGSAIRPAAFCGVVGYKPSQGLIPNTGVLRFSKRLDQVGVFARSVEDATLLASALTAQPFTASQRVTPLSAARAPHLAAVRSPAWERAEAPQREAFINAVHVLEKAGATIDDAELSGSCLQAHEAHRTIMFAEGAHALRHLWQDRRGEMSTVLCKLIEEGLGISASSYLDALDVRSRVQEELAALLHSFDAILTPPATGEAPATLGHTGDPVFCTIWTLAGLPALTIPVTLGPQGLPLGLQIVGAARKDEALLGIARWCEQHLPFPGLFHSYEEERE